MSLLNLSYHTRGHEGAAVTRPSARFMRGHPARWVALGFGAGLSPLAPGTVGTLWAWLSFLLLDRWLTAPMKTVPGTRMIYAGMSDPVRRKEVIDYLETLK